MSKKGPTDVKKDQSLLFKPTEKNAGPAGAASD
jgi:hypothetical protein